ncbi:MAG: RNA pseudouridine synthase [Sediminibacterium sp.]|nr:RNA pseudouridine synthase [Sediminibacterium sp.]
MNKLPPIIFENMDFIVLDKPAGLLSIPDRMDSEVNLKRLLQQKFGQIFTVHRLDKNTSGLILFAKHEQAHKQLSLIFEERKIEKKYIGLVEGNLPKNSDTIELPIMAHPGIMGKMIIHTGGKMAITKYKTIESFNRYTFAAFDIYTGRTHQIRVHLQELGYPIVCDELYGTNKPIYYLHLKKSIKYLKIKKQKIQY